MTESTAVRWVFTLAGSKVGALAVTSGVKLPSAFQVEVINEQLNTGETLPMEDILGQSGQAREPHPRGMLQRREFRGAQYVYRWGPGKAGDVDWIHTGEKATGAVYASYRSPASGRHDDRADNDLSSVSSDLTAELGWDGDGYQKAAVSFAAKPYMWESIQWMGETWPLVDESKPVIKGTLTLTGPDDTVISTEVITTKGQKPPHEMAFTREFALKNQPPGTYTLAFTKAVKTGGRRGSKARVGLSDHVLTFTVGKPRD
ncbi:hypothetical protein ACWGH5_39255 [Streptomyces sp. NPDC054864]